MEPENIATNLRLLAEENRRKAEFFERAADLHENGYQTDQARIDSEIEMDRQARSAQISELEVMVSEKDAEILRLTEENTQLKNPAEPVSEPI